MSTTVNQISGHQQYEDKVAFKEKKTVLKKALVHNGGHQQYEDNVALKEKYFLDMGKSYSASNPSFPFDVWDKLLVLIRSVPEVALLIQFDQPKHRVLCDK